MDPRIEKYLNTNIKDIIIEFKEVRQALDLFDIGCAPCSLGTCKLSDVVEIHNLNAENEKKLFDLIFAIIYPGETFKIPRVSKGKKNSKNSVNLSPPLRLLVEEHKLIKRVIALVPGISEKIDISKPDHVHLINYVVDFIRSYADKFHHAKEEDILFLYFDSSLDIINVMLNDHKQGRIYVANILQAVEEENTFLVKENLNFYANLLSEHIIKEDTILYPWMDKNLVTRQIGELYSKFSEIKNANPEIQSIYEKLVITLEKEFIQ